MNRDWREGEPGLREFREEVRVVRLRMRQRWLATGIFAVLVTVLVVAWKATRRPSYQAAIVIRLVEHELDEDTRPPTSRDITQYFYDISLSRPTLLAVIDKYELYPERRFDPSWAIEAMKDDIEIEVLSNYFSPEIYIANPLRDARVVIRYHAPEPQLALDVVRELGALIAERESRVRQRIADLTAEAGTDAQRVLRGELMMVSRELTRLNIKPDKTPLDIVQIRRLSDEIRELDRELTLLTRKTLNLSLRDELEESSMGLRFELIDDGKLPARSLTKAQSLAILAFITFFLVLPVVGVGVSALDTRIYDRHSLRRLGIRTLGQLPSLAKPEARALGNRKTRGTV
jgi:uncharacterized protein involved in exopolysaccharide biosynthesis